MTRYSVNNNTHRVLLYLFVQIEIISSVSTPQTASNFRHLLSCGTIVISGNYISRAKAVHRAQLSKRSFNLHVHSFDVRLAGGSNGFLVRMQNIKNYIASAVPVSRNIRE